MIASFDSGPSRAEGKEEMTKTKEVTKATPKTLSQLTTDDVNSVYSGKAGHCACGCAGKHSYSSAHRAFASKWRGYRVEDEEINDRMVARVLRILQANPSSEVLSTECAHVEIGARLYVIYLVGSTKLVEGK